MEDDYVHKNPFNFDLKKVIVDNTEAKTPLDAEQEKSLLNFLQANRVCRKYYDKVVILLGTGLRISAFCGLTRNDVDMEKGGINIDHQLQKESSMLYQKRDHNNMDFINLEQTFTEPHSAPSHRLFYTSVVQRSDGILVVQNSRPPKWRLCCTYLQGCYRRCVSVPPTPVRWHPGRRERSKGRYIGFLLSAAI